jgi:hypothetical protein
MGKVDASKERHWRKLIRRQGKTGETVARFCAREGVPVHQFYWWQRTLRARDRQSTTECREGHDPASADEQAAKSFVPVRLPFLTHAPIEVVHPGGCVVRVPVGFDPLLLRRILATLDPSAADAAEN